MGVGGDRRGCNTGVTDFYLIFQRMNVRREKRRQEEGRQAGWHFQAPGLIKLEEPRV
jgi:hypothetical protein